MTKALSIALMLLAAGGSAVAQGHDDAHPGCTTGLLHQRAIEHGDRHQPTTGEIACKQAVKGRSSLDADADRVIAELYADVMRRSALSEPGGTLEQRAGRGDLTQSRSGGPETSVARGRASWAGRS